MRPANTSKTKPFHLLSRYAYLEEVVDGQRVVVLGSAEPDLAALLVDRGAHKVLCVSADEEIARAAERACKLRQVRFDAGPLDSLDVRGRSSDVVIIDDLSAVSDPDAVVDEARRVLVRGGVLVACTRNHDARSSLSTAPRGRRRGRALSYDAFYGVLAESFDHVRLVAQCPIVGYVMADLAGEDDEPPMTFDPSLLPEGSEDSEHFVAFCSDSPFNPDPFTVVQIPVDWVNLAGGKDATAEPSRSRREPARPPRRDPGLSDELDRAQAEITALRQRQGELQSQADLATGEVRSLKLEIDKRAVVSAQMENERNDAREKASLEHTRVVEAKLALQGEKKRHLTLEKELEMSRRLQKLGQVDTERLKEAESKLAAAEAEVTRLAASATEAEERARDLESRLASAPPPAPAEDTETQDKLSRLTAELNEARAALKGAETRAAEAEELKKQLTAARTELAGSKRTSTLEQANRLFGAPSPAPAPEPAAAPTSEPDVDTTSEELEGLRTRVRQLEEDLIKARRVRSAPSGLERQLKEAQQELRATRNELQLAQDEASRLRGQVEEANESLAAATAREEKLTALLDEARHQLEQAQRDGAAGDDVERLRAELAQARSAASTSAELAARLEALEPELARSRESLEAHKTRISELEARVTDRPGSEEPQETSEREPVDQDALAELQAELRAAQAAMTECEHRQEAEVGSLETALRDRAREVQQLQAELHRQGQLLKNALDDLQIATSQRGVSAPAEPTEPDSALTERLAELEERSSRLANELKEQRRATTKLEELARRAQALEAQLEERGRSIAQLEGELQGMRWRQDEAAVTPTPEQPAHHKVEADDTKDRALAQAKEQIAQLMGQLARLEASTNMAKGELSAAQADADSATLENAELKACLERVETQDRSAAEAESRAADEYKAERAKRLEAQEEVSLLRRQLAKAEAEGGSEELTQKAAKLEEELNEAKASVSDLEGLREKVAHLTREAEHADVERKALKAALDQAMAAPVKQSAAEGEGLAKAEAERKRAEEALSRVMDDLASSSSQASALTDLVATRDDELAKLREQLAQAGAESSTYELARQLDAARRVVSTLEEDKKRLSEELDQLRKG